MRLPASRTPALSPHPHVPEPQASSLSLELSRTSTPPGHCFSVSHCQDHSSSALLMTHPSGPSLQVTLPDLWTGLCWPATRGGLIRRMLPSQHVARPHGLPALLMGLFMRLSGALRIPQCLTPTTLNLTWSPLLVCCSLSRELSYCLRPCTEKGF